MKKVDITNNFINSWKPIFDKYPIEKIPVYAWGRYYKYESSGGKFEVTTEEGIESFYYMVEDEDIDWKLVEEIDKNEDYTQMFYPNRKNMVKYWDFDDAGGNCVILFRNEDNIIELKIIDCDSPE